MLKLVSLLGLCGFLAVAWGLSNNRKRFPWRTVLSGLGLQFLFGLLILKTDVGKSVFGAARTAAEKLIEVSVDGAAFVFGPLANEDLLADKLGPEHSFIFVVVVTATIIVVSSLSAALYHYGILQKVVQAFAWVMQRAMHTTGSESLAAAANIFMGQTEAPLVVKPYLPHMTPSELMALMTGGMATIAGGVMAAYVSFGIDAGHLLTASVMSAPAALLVAKIMIPETEKSETASGAKAEIEIESTNGLDALCRGASQGALLAINVMAMLIAFVAIVALVNYLISAPQTALGVADPVTLERLFGWLNAPFAFLMGVPRGDCVAVGEALGERIVLNEFIGYLTLAGIQETVDERSYRLATYALCGFANFSSIAIQIGGIGSLAPDRRKDLARLGGRAMIGGVLASYLTAAMVGILT